MWTVPIFVVVLVLAACGGAGPSPSGDVAAEPAGWRPLPDSPLSARTQAHAFWTGSKVLVIGGTDDDRCPPNADCVPSEEPPLTDGAAYDVESDKWTALPDAPVPLGELSGAVLDGTLYVWVYGFEPAPGVRPAFLSLTPGDAAWRELTAPAVQNAFLYLVADDDQLIAYHGAQELGVQPDLAYHPTEDEWTDLPSTRSRRPSTARSSGPMSGSSSSASGSFLSPIRQRLPCMARRDSMTSAASGIACRPRK